MKNSWSIAIIIAAIFTAMPRWIIALLAGEGLMVPEEWKSSWIIISAILAACMAVVEGLAFAYVFRTWRSQSGKAADTLFYLVIASAIAFVFTLSPSMAASVRGVTVNEFLENNAVLLLWTTSVALSTILIVVSVGYSEKSVNIDPKLQSARDELSALRRELADAKQNERWAWLNSGTKKEKIQKARAVWPDLPQKSIAIICETTESYVSQNIKDKNTNRKGK